MIHLKTIIFLCCTVFVLSLVSCDPAKTSNDLPSTIGLPVITTTEPIAIMATTATVGGTITADGGAKVTARGVCWAVTATPTIADAHTTDSVGIGTFISHITGLVANTVYYVRAYATNIKGTVYGNLYSFTSGGTVTDIDGNVYQTVTIGTQTWMAENLKTTKYHNGELIGTTTPATIDVSLESNPKYQWAYDGDESNVSKYGRLYTWYAVADSRNIAPVGWHVATVEDWTALEKYVAANLGTSITVAKALSATTDWYLSNYDGVGKNIYLNNFSGFTALPGGYRDKDSFYGVLTIGFWWSSVEYTATYAWSRDLSFYKNNLFKNYSAKSYGFSVRCVKDY